MNYSVEKQKGAVKVDFTLTADEWKEALSQAYLMTRGKYNIPGFRKGHAPRGVIESMYGKGVFFDDAFETSFRRAYGEVMDKETWIFPVDDPKVDLGDMDEEKFTFSATITTKPEFELGAYKGLEIPKAEVDVKPSEVDAEVEHARMHASRIIEVTDRAIQKGDVVTLDYSGSVDGVKFEGGTAQNQELEIGSNSFIPGFEDGMIGLTIGQTSDLRVKFPEDYHAKELAGKDAVFTVTVHAIKVKEMPQLNDEFARDVSECETLADYKKSIEDKIRSDKQHRADVDSENEMLKIISGNCEIDVPQCMIDKEVDYMLADFEMQLKQYYGGMSLKDYFKYTGLKELDFRRQRRESAISNVKIRLVLEKIIEAEKIEVSEKELEEEVEKFVSHSKEHGREFDEHALSHQRAYIKSDLLMAKVIDFLKKSNKFVAKKEDAATDGADKKPVRKKASSDKKTASKKSSTAKSDKKDE
ncbi:MAG: trigger factor [Clostridia bacterium]|nr:trigger factor [Clostridia bacterium]